MTWASAVVLGGVVCAAACAQTVVRIDASAAVGEPEAARYVLTDAARPDGHTVGVNSRYLTRDGKPWLPVMGEMHFSRVPRADWDGELAKMKAAGVDIVAAYVIWIHHEEIEGEFEWTGQKDLRAFTELCAKHGLLLEVRVGPWAHGEVRYGGLPDWVMKQGPVRQNDAKYLAATGRWFDAIGKQLTGLMWKDGGPVVAVQLENEYSARGAGMGEEHIRTLKQMVRKSGLDVPYYVVTGWDNAVLPAPDVMAVYGGGYPDAPWDASTGKLAPPEVYAFRFASRVAANMGAMGAHGTGAAHTAESDGTPYMTAEIGGGNEGTYHRRPVITADDIGAMFPVMLGSGVNLYGTYMFRGGRNPEGRLTTLQESQATGYPNDVPIKSYDFQAPIGEFGEERTSLRKMKVYQYFLNAFGEELAPMAVYAPEALPASTADLSAVRASVRARGNSGFVFCNNHVRNYAMPRREAVQFEVKLAGGTVRIPERPVAVPADAYFVWPFGQRLGGAELRYATAQMMTRLAGARETVVFAAVRGIAPEFAFEARTVKSVKVLSGAVRTVGGVTFVEGVKPGVDAWIDVTAQDGTATRLLVLSAEDAENAWRVHADGAERLLVTKADVAPDLDGPVRLRQRGAARFGFALVPAVEHAPQASVALRRDGAEFVAEAPQRALKASVKLVAAAGEAAPVKLGPLNGRDRPVAQAPAEGPLAGAGRWAVEIPAGAGDGLNEVYLEIGYAGDVARLSAGGRLLEDNFFDGKMWSVGLKQMLGEKIAGPLELSVLPLRRDAPVYFELAQPVEFDANGQAARVDSVKLVPEYEVRVGLE
ncbi:MAG TPA: beta-galactosidase [Terracidiphilus sp.]|nr:beta-galactosidase [Terracidiphilus sp.]